MSALWAPTTGYPDHPAAGEQERTRLRAVGRPRPRLARMPFVLVLIAIFGVGMAGLLMLNTTLQNQAFQVGTLNRQATELTYTQADLQSQLDTLAAPQELARRASAYGLRPNPHPAYLLMPSGKVVGTPQRVTGNEVPSQVIKSPAQLAAEKAAAEARAQAAADKKAAALQAKKVAAERKAAEQETAQPAGGSRPADAATKPKAQQKRAGDTAKSTRTASRSVKKSDSAAGHSSAAQQHKKKDTARGGE